VPYSWCAIRRIRLVFEDSQARTQEFVVRASTGEPDRRVSAIAAISSTNVDVGRSRAHHRQRNAKTKAPGVERLRGDRCCHM
jgi:hypothetical protein